MFVIRNKKKRYERKASACDITAAMVKVKENNNYATECSIRKIIIGTSDCDRGLCARTRALVISLLCYNKPHTRLEQATDMPRQAGGLASHGKARSVGAID